MKHSWMRNLSLASGLVLAASACGGDNKDSNPTLIEQRPYGLKVPAGYDGSTPMPLIVTLHGLGSNGLEQATYSGLLDAADQRGFFLAYPDGTLVFGMRAWNAAIGVDLPVPSDDVTYLRAVIADIEENYAIDPKQVFVEGISNGAFMSHVMACEAADKVAAIAPLAGTLWTDDVDLCAPSEPVAVLDTHGTADTTIAYDGGTFAFGTLDASYVGAQDVVDMWINRDGCAATPTTDTADIETTLAGAETTIERYGSCADGADVELWTIAGGPHVPTFNDTYRDAVLDFFFSHPKP